MTDKPTKAPFNAAAQARAEIIAAEPSVPFIDYDEFVVLRRDRLSRGLTKALQYAHDKGRDAGAEQMRERAVKVVARYCLMESDRIISKIEALPLTPDPKPPMDGKNDEQTGQSDG